MEYKKRAAFVPNPMTPNTPVTFDESRCTGCNHCVEVCRTDVLMPNPEKGKPPIVLYPDECWFCGCCVEDCPVEGASCFHHPLSMRNVWKRHDTGELLRSDIEGNYPPSDIKEF